MVPVRTIKNYNVSVSRKKCLYLYCVRCVALRRSPRVYLFMCCAYISRVCFISIYGTGATLSNYAVDHLSYREYDKYYVVMHRDVDCRKIVSKQGNKKKTGLGFLSFDLVGIFIARVPQLVLR
jgi:hypothetical protein